VLPTTPSVPHPVAPKTESAVIDMTGWKQIGGQTGSNKGGLFEAPNGDRYYVKSAKSAAHAKNEVLAANLYRMAGIDVPEVRHGTNHPDGWTNVIASKIVPNAKTDPSKLKNDVIFKAKVQQGFATDAWLSNWDTVGLEFDNVVDSDGKPWRIDVGGSLEYRAQGQPKGDLFGNVVVELDTLRDSKMNPQSAAVFGGMSNGQIRESAKMLLPITDDKIRQAVKDQGLPDSLADKLIARRNYILDEFNLQKPDVTPTSSLANPAAPPKPATIQVSHESIIEDWGFTAKNTYAPNQIVAFSTDGEYRIVGGAHSKELLLQRKQPSGTWTVYEYPDKNDTHAEPDPRQTHSR
jgi:hypothetical protein